MNRFMATAACGLILALSACDSEIVVVETGENQTSVVADTDIDPAKVVCDQRRGPQLRHEHQGRHRLCQRGRGRRGREENSG